MVTSLLVGQPAVANQDIRFNNFSIPVILTLDGKNYRVEGTSHRVRLSHRLIVQTKKKVEPNEIDSYHPGIEKVQTLFIGGNAFFYLIHLKAHYQLQKVLDGLSQKSQVLLVQPDILQINQKTGKGGDSAKANSEYKHYLDSVLKIEQLWSRSKGAGSTIAIIDDGFALQHPEFAGLNLALEIDIHSRAFSARPQLLADTHGTRVAGVIFAAHDKNEIEGLAPAASLVAIRQVDTWTSNTLLSLQIANLAGADVINCSWNSPWLLQALATAINDMALYGREGKGAAVVVSAGNQAIEITPNSTEAAIDGAIVVGAIDPHFKILQHSNFGRSVDIWGYGKQVKTTAVKGDFDFLAGTSLAAAVVSGLSALLISQSPDMTLNQLINHLKQMTRTESVIQH